jgi:hypothetical protein
MAEFIDRMGFSRNLFDSEFRILELEVTFKLALCEYQKHNLLNALVKSSEKKAKQSQLKLKKFYLGELKFVNFLAEKAKLSYCQFKLKKTNRMKYLCRAKHCPSLKKKEFTKYLCDKEVDELIDFEERLYQQRLEKYFQKLERSRKNVFFLKNYEKNLFSLGVFPY